MARKCSNLSLNPRENQEKVQRFGIALTANGIELLLLIKQ